MYLIAKRQVRLHWSVLVGLESVVTGSAPHTPPPSTPYTQKLFKSNLDIVVNISCKFQSSLKISILLKIQSWRAVLICSRLTRGQAHTIWVMLKKGFLGSLAISSQSATENVKEKMSKAITLSVVGIYSSNKVQTVRKIVLQIFQEKYMGSDSIYREARNIT